VLPCVEVFVADVFFIWVTFLRNRLALRLVAHLVDSALRCVGVPIFGEAVLKSLPPSQNLFLSILHLVF
jgi:hypothetical protein